MALADVRDAHGGVRDMKNILAENRLTKFALPAPTSEPSDKVTCALKSFGDDLEPLLSCWELLDGRARLIISRDGKLIGASEGACTLLNNGSSHLCATALTSSCREILPEQIERILSVAVGAAETIVLHKRSGKGHYVVSAIGISAGAVAIAVRNADGDFTSTLADLEAAFGLTRCETLAVQGLMRGLAPHLIANELEVSVHTVRAHLRHSYDKLRVCSREELWEKLAPYRLN